MATIPNGMTTGGGEAQEHEDDIFERAIDVLEEIDAELDRQVYLSSGRDQQAFGAREDGLDLPADYEHHVIITEAMWDKIREVIVRATA